MECLAFSNGDLVTTFGGRKHGHADFCWEICELQFKYREKLSSRIPANMVNCMLKNASYCQYTFSYKLEDWTKNGPEKVFLHLDEDGEKGICPTVVKIDYFGMIIGGI